MNRLPQWLFATILIAGCHYHQDTNAPGIIDVDTPPEDIRRESLEYPGDPGERMVVVSSGVVAGGGGRSAPPHGVGDFALEGTLSWGESDTTHNDAIDRLFVPDGALWPPSSIGVTLGWSALRVLGGSHDDTETEVGPIYVEVQRTAKVFGLGGGWAFAPWTGQHGPQLNAFAGPFFLRSRFLFDGGVEVHTGLQIKIPTTWVQRR